MRLLSIKFRESRNLVLFYNYAEQDIFFCLSNVPETSKLDEQNIINEKQNFGNFSCYSLFEWF